jgi:hypothetical protein
MKFRTWAVGVAGLVVVVVVMLGQASGAAANDAVLDAKRKAAAQLLKDGKTADALTLLGEVTKTDDTFWGDHLMMARACEKLGRASEALHHYKRVLELTPGAPAAADERAARQEADKRVKQLDPMGGKIDAVVDEYVRKLDTLEREAIASRNMAALERIFRLRGMIWEAEKVKDAGFCEVQAHGEWQTTGLTVKEGQTYRVRAAGTWSVKGERGLVECTAAGTKERADASVSYRMGQLLGQVNGKQMPLGEDVTFTAPASGMLMLIEGDLGESYRTANKGSLQVLIAPAR